MQNLIFLLMMRPFIDNHMHRDSLESLIMFIFIFSIPLSWVIPYIVRKNRNKQKSKPYINSTVNDKIELLKDLAALKEKGIVNEEEFITQKNKILGKDS